MEQIAGGVLKLCAVVVFVACGMPSEVFGQAGKIAGRITDSFGEPLPGANVLVRAELVGGEPIAMPNIVGGSANVDGEYFILNVRPGSYVIEARFVGFQTVVQQPVRVASNQTTTLDFQLPDETFVGDEVIVTAQRSLVERDLTSSSSKVSGEDINELPVESIADVLELQAGVTTGPDGSLHIRGGRSSEIQYYVDGIAVTNPFSGGLAVPIENNAIQELEVISGTFNAEFGQAMSGIVSIVTREGTEELKGDVSIYTGDFLSGNDEVFLGIDDIDPFGQLYVDGSLSGPLPFGLNFFVSGRYADQDNWLFGRDVYRPFDVSTGVEGTDDQYNVVTSGDSSLVPMAPFKSLSGQGKVTARPTGRTKLSYTLIAGQTEGRSYDHRYRLNPRGVPVSETSSFNHLVRLEQTLSNRAFVTLNLSYYVNDLTSRVYEQFDDVGYTANIPRSGIPISNIFLTGGVNPNVLDRRSETMAARTDLTMQIGGYHLVKTGVEVRSHVLDYRQFTVVYDPVRDAAPRRPLQSSVSHDAYVRKPLELAAYVQDKIEYQDLIVNVGLRFDYFDANALVPTDVRDPSNTELARPEGEAYREVDPKYQIAPRLGLAFPITERGVFYASYGQFLQIPEFSRLYENPEFEVVNPSGDFIGNADLDAQRTTMYEIGLRQELTPFLAADVTSFYRDVRSLLGAELNEVYVSRDRYGRYVTDDFGSVRGVTVALDAILREQGVSAGLDYTYQVARGLASNPQQDAIDDNNNVEPTARFLPLNWDLRHALSGYLNLVRSSWSGSVVGRIGSGYPFTPDEYRIVGAPDDGQFRNAGLYDGEFIVDLRAAKRFQVRGFKPEIFLKVENLFDFFRAERLPEIDPNIQAGHTGNNLDAFNTLEEYLQNPIVQPIPREVRLGLRVSF